MDIQEVDFRGLQTGDVRAFERIFYRYYKRLVSYGMRYGLEQMETEDMVMEIFHRIWEIREKIQSAAALHSFLFTAVRNRSLNILRNLKNRQDILLQLQDGIEESEEEQCFLMEEEMSRLLDEAVGQLPKQCQEVIVGLLAGKSLAEVATEMDISINTAKTYKMRAVQALRELLKDAPPFMMLWILIKFE